MSREELSQLKKELENRYHEVQAQGLNLNMARGKPSEEQVELSMPMLDTLNSRSKMTGLHRRGLPQLRYGDGLPELRLLFAEMMGVDDHNIIVGGNSSLNMMFDVISCAMTHGFSNCEPWMHQGTPEIPLSFSRLRSSFAITEYFGMELIEIPMTPEGPDMDEVERWVNNDPQVKGIWCVPKYSNPQGYTYSDETVRRFAALRRLRRIFVFSGITLTVCTISPIRPTSC